MAWKNLLKLTARVRGDNAWNAAENRELEECHINNSGELLAAQHCLPLTEIVRHGESWQVLSPAASPANAIPTTAGRFRLWNGEPGDGKSYIIDSIAAVKVVVDVTAAPVSLFCQHTRGPVAAITDAGNTIRSLSGRTYGGKARTDAAASGAESGRWDFAGQMTEIPQAVAGTPWEVVDISLFGRFVVPPGGAFVVYPAQIVPQTNAVRMVIRWHEVVLPMVS